MTQIAAAVEAAIDALSQGASSEEAAAAAKMVAGAPEIRQPYGRVPAELSPPAGITWDFAMSRAAEILSSTMPSQKHKVRESKRLTSCPRARSSLRAGSHSPANSPCTPACQQRIGSVAATREGHHGQSRTGLRRGGRFGSSLRCGRTTERGVSTRARVTRETAAEASTMPEDLGPCPSTCMDAVMRSQAVATAIVNSW